MMFSKRVLWTARALCAASVCVLLFAAAEAASSSWDGPTVWNPDVPPATFANGPEWTDSVNWTDGLVPNGAGDIATFDSLTGRLNFQLAADITLGGLDVTSQRIDSRGVTVRTFTWDNNGSEVIINHPGSEFLLEHNHALSDSVKITKSGGQTRFSRLVSGPGGFILSGNQELILGETATPNTFEGGVEFLDTSRVDVRRPVATGSGAFVFTSTSSINSKITPRNDWSAVALPNDVVVAAGGFGWIEEASNHPDREFSGDVSGDGALRLESKNSLWQFTGDNSGFIGALLIQGDGDASDLFGVEGVFNSAATINLANAAVFHIASANAIGDSGMVNLLDSASFFQVGAGLDELIGSGLLTVNGLLIEDGIYTNAESWIGGAGTITVGVTAIPEPSALLLAVIGLPGLLFWRRRRNIS